MAEVILRPVQRRAFAVAALLAALASSGAAQGEPEQRSSSRITTVGVDYTYTRFGGQMDPWHLTALSLAARDSWGSVIWRINLASRFATTGTQYEVDAYPALGKGKYAYLSAGFSPATIFPEQRYGAEYFTALPHAYEASIGLRSLRFSSEKVTLFTGSVGRYTGNYWFSFRPYLRRKPGGDASASGNLTARRYYADADTYIGARIGAGTAPTETLDPSQLGRESSVTAGFHASRPLSSRAITTWVVNFERDRNPSRTLNRLEFGGGLKVRF